MSGASTMLNGSQLMRSFSEAGSKGFFGFLKTATATDEKVEVDSA